MTRISALVLAVMLLFGAHEAMAADGEVRTCSLNKVIECTPDERCEELSVQEVDLPRFVRIDLKSKTLNSLDKSITRSSKIASVEHREGLVIMHGTELRGWSMTLAEESGNLTLSAAGDNEGFVVFGSCITP
jgi:hypothetical protein